MDLLTSFVGEIMAFRGASLLIIGGILAGLGGALSVLGVIRSNHEQQELILGEQHTFCQMIVYVDAGVGWYVSTFHRGSGNIYDLEVLIREVREDSTPISHRQRHPLGTLTSNTWPWRLYDLGIRGPQTNLAPRYFEVQITQRNGTSLQDIVIYPRRDGQVQLGFLRLQFNGKDYEPQFHYLPRGAEGVSIPATEKDRIAGLRRTRGPQP